MASEFLGCREAPTYELVADGLAAVRITTDASPEALGDPHRQRQDPCSFLQHHQEETDTVDFGESSLQ